MGWLGKLGLISPVGDNLFETLMLNLIFLRDGTEEWEKQLPTWEYDNPRTDTDLEKCAVSIPNNPAELYTTQFRRILLVEKTGYVISFHDRSGDWFPDEDIMNGFAEQMTMWRKDTKNKEGNVFKPKTLDPSVQIWREFSSIAAQDESGRTPGSVAWINAVKNIIGRNRMVRFKVVGVVYGNMNSSLDSVYSDSLSFHNSLLGEVGRVWRAAINEQISRCDRIADFVGRLAQDISIAQGGNGVSARTEAKEQFYYRIDEPFRIWLSELDPNGEEDIKRQMTGFGIHRDDIGIS